MRDGRIVTSEIELCLADKRVKLVSRERERSFLCLVREIRIVSCKGGKTYV